MRHLAPFHSLQSVLRGDEGDGATSSSSSDDDSDVEVAPKGRGKSAQEVGGGGSGLARAPGKTGPSSLSHICTSSSSC